MKDINDMENAKADLRAKKFKLDTSSKKDLVKKLSDELKNRAEERIHSGKSFPMEIPRNSMEYCSGIGIDYENDKDATQKANIDISDKCRALTVLYEESQRQDRTNNKRKKPEIDFNTKLKTESTVVLVELIRKIMQPRKSINGNADVSIDFEKPCNFDKVRNFCAKYTQSVRTRENMFGRRKNTNTRNTIPDFYGE